MQKNVCKFYRIIAFLLVFTLTIASVPTFKLFQEGGGIVYAADPNNAEDPNNADRWESPSYNSDKNEENSVNTELGEQAFDNGSYRVHTDTYANSELQGLYFTNIESASNDISKAGIYLDNTHNDYLYMYITAKKTSSASLFYRTWGFMITPYSWNDFQTCSDTLASRNVPYLQVGITYNGEKRLETKPVNITNAMTGSMSNLEFTKCGSSFIVPNSDKSAYKDDTYDNGALIGTCYRIPKSGLYTAFAPQVLAESPGKEITMHMYGIQEICKSGSWSNPYYNCSSMISAMSGFSDQAKSDIPKLYKPTFTLKAPEFSVSVIHAKTGNILATKSFTSALKISDVSEASTGLYIAGSFKWAMFQADLDSTGGVVPSIDENGQIMLEGKKYFVQGVSVIPGTFEQASTKDGYSEYADSIVKTNLRSELTDFNEIFGVDASNKTYVSKFSTLGANFYKTTTLDTDMGVQPSGGSSTLDFKNCVAKFQNLNEIKDYSLRYWNPLLGCRMYIIVNPSNNLQNYDGQILCVNGLTGTYFDCYNKKVDYEATRREALVSSIGSKQVSDIDETDPDKIIKLNNITSEQYNIANSKYGDSFKKNGSWVTDSDYNINPNTTLAPTIESANGVIYELQKVEFVTKFEPDSLKMPKQGWEAFINQTEIDTVKKVQSGGTAYLSDTANTNEPAHNNTAFLKADSPVMKWATPMKFSQVSIKKTASGAKTNIAVDLEYRFPNATTDYKYDNNEIENTPAIPLYRAIYLPQQNVPVIYYDEETGNVLASENNPKRPEQTVQTSIVKGDTTYYLHEISYRKDTTLSKDIEETKIPVMNEKDLGRVTDKNYITIPPELSDLTVNIPYVIRVACGKIEKPLATSFNWDLGKYTIPAQYLIKDFNMNVVLPENVKGEKIELSSTVYKEEDIKSSHNYKDDKGNEQTCKATYLKHEWRENIYNWNANLNKILSPNSDILFADKYTGTSNGYQGQLSRLVSNGGVISGSVVAKANSEKVFTDLDFLWSSMRNAYGNFKPTLAKYKNSDNADARAFLVKHNIFGYAVNDDALKPVSDGYSSSSGSTDFSLKIEESGRNNGYTFDWKKLHPSCSIGDYFVKTMTIAPKISNVTLGTAKGSILAEETHIASSKPMGEKKSISSNNGSTPNTKWTFYMTPKSPLSDEGMPINFYPYYTMKLGTESGDKNIYVLGKEQRKLLPVNVAEVEIRNLNDTITTVNSTWSRDAADVNKTVTKGGSVIEAKNSKAMEVKVTTYTVVPKAGYVENDNTYRDYPNSFHNSIVNSLSSSSNYMLASNLPESFNNSAPSDWQKFNTHKIAGDNVNKSRIPNCNASASVSNSPDTTLSISAFDSAFPANDANGKKIVNNQERINAQLETAGWYEEKFDGFEVIKKVSTIKVSYQTTKFVNFIRNGNTDGNPNNYSDLAVQTRNIPNKSHGVEFIYFNPEVNIFNRKVSVELNTKPALFHVRGSIYENRTQ